MQEMPGRPLLNTVHTKERTWRFGQRGPVQRFIAAHRLFADTGGAIHWMEHCSSAAARLVSSARHTQSLNTREESVMRFCHSETMGPTANTPPYIIKRPEVHIHIMA